MKPRILAAARFFESGGNPPPQAPAVTVDEHAVSYYVAGFSNGNSSKSTQEKTEALKRMIPQIMEDAKLACGDKVIVIIVLSEYALTYDAISTNEKNESVAALQAVVNAFDNLILVPGSYAVVDQPADKQRRARKISKLHQNYLFMSSDAGIASDANFKDEKEAVKKAKLETSELLQNCTYLMSANHKVKHKKTFPYFEHERVKNSRKEDNRVFYIGADSALKEVHAGGIKLDTGISICRDITSPLHKHELLQLPPLLHIIVSSPLGHHAVYWYGALTVHIDSERQLAVAINPGHYRYKEIKAVKGVLYDLNSTDKEEVKIIKFTEVLQPNTLPVRNAPGL